MQRLVAIGCLALALAGCKKTSTGASEYFVQKYSCPAERVTVTAKPDLKPSEVFQPPFAEPSPPDEVKNDPGRLEVWNAAQATKRQNWDRLFSNEDIFQVSGCGHDVVMGCKLARNTVGNKTMIYFRKVNCTEPSAKSNIDVAALVAEAKSKVADATSKADAAVQGATAQIAQAFSSMGSATSIQKAAIAKAFAYSNFAATPYTGKPASVHIDTSDAKEYRTELTKAASDGANFAGHYTLVQIGAGAGTVVVAVVDAMSGDVYFPKKLTLVNVGDWSNDPSGLVFQPDSNLLVVYGRSGSEEAPSGVSYFLWTGKDFQLLKFVPEDPGHPPK